MVVYIAFRRGTWVHRLLAPFAPTAVRHALSSLASLTWVQCMLVFTVRCVPEKCTYCKRSASPSVDYIQQTRKCHLLTVAVDEYGLHAGVDIAFDKNEAWMFLKLPKVMDSDALSFWRARDAGPKAYNVEGGLFNFMPWWIRLGGETVGIKADNDIANAKSFFCSELLTAFVQLNKYPLGLTPCETTPQQLLDALVSHDKGQLRRTQFRLTDSATHAKPLEELFKNVCAHTKG